MRGVSGRSAALLAAVAGVAAVDAAGQVAVYSNLANQQPWVAASSPQSPWWDDATIVGGGRLTGLSVVVHNSQSNPPRVFDGAVRIHLYDEAADLPNGPLLGIVPLNSGTPMNPTESRLVGRDDLEGLGIDLPDGARLGLMFDFDQFNFGVRLYTPPTIGSTENEFWLGNPPVAIGPGNFVWDGGFEIRVPGVGGVCLMGLGAGVMCRRRRGE